MPTHYLGTTANGVTVSRKSTRSDFTHAAVSPSYTRTDRRIPSFGTSADGAARNYPGRDMPEIVPVAIVDAAAYRAATSGKTKGR